MTIKENGKLYPEDIVANGAKAWRFSPARWRPSKLLAVIIVWLSMVELTDVFILHNISFPSSLAEDLADVVVLIAFVAPIYFLLYRPLKVRWEQELKTQQEVRSLNRQLMQASEEERRKLALELHDHFGQMTTTLQCKAEMIQSQLATTDIAAEQACKSLIESVSQLGQDIRKFTSDLRPDMLDDLGLVDTLKWYTSDLSQQHPSLQFDYSSVGIKKRLPTNIEIALYRVCQEALNNIIKHSNANRASVTLAYSHPIIILTVRDDGDGMPDPKSLAFDKTYGIGLLGMRERLAAVGGTLEISSIPGEKTTVRALIPVNGEAEPAWL